MNKLSGKLLSMKASVIDTAILVCLATAFLSVTVTRYSPYYSTILVSDPGGYYIYLPAVFVYKDVHRIPEKVFVGNCRNDKNELYTKFTCGVAYFYLPFFLAAHAYNYIFHLDTSGYSDPYYLAVMMCGAVWAFIGLFLLRKFLLKYFSRGVTWITLLMIVLGTSFLNYATLEAGMSHIYSFALFAAVILATDSYYEYPSARKAMLIGFLIGWIVLTRPTNIALLPFLLLYRVVTLDNLKERFYFLKNHSFHILVAIPFVILPVVPQLLYWKTMTGHWIKYSYDNERFIYWSHPKIAEVLFDTQNGLFIYAPILLFLFWGLFARRKDPRTNFIGVSIVFVTITYVFASWWAWNFGGAFGHRCYVDYYSILAFPLAVTVEKIIGMKSYMAKVPLFFLMALLCYYSVGLSQLYGRIGFLNGPDWQWNWDSLIGVTRMIFGLPPTHPNQ